MSVLLILHRLIFTKTNLVPMKQIFLTLFACVVFAATAQAQKTLEVQVNAPGDDLEEYIPSPGQTQTIGALDAGSSDLELGSEAAGNTAAQLVGMRFNAIDIPKGAIILSAHLQFQVDATSKNTDPCQLWISAENAANPVTFDAATPFNISARPRLNDSVYWQIPAGSWATVGEAGADQRSTDIAQLVQALVNRNDWNTGNSMVFLIWGSGTREAESQDGSPSGAPKLVIQYLEVKNLEAQVSAPEDDLEEYIPGPGQTQTVGALDAGSSDLELGSETAGNTAQQLVGVRFRDLNIPKGAAIQSAYLQFQVDATAKNTDPCNIWISAQDAGNPVTFDAGTPFNISARPRLNDSIYWPIPAASWGTVGAAGPDQRSTDIAELVQALVNRPDWAEGQSMVFLLWGQGTREAESQDGSPAGAPKLIVNYVPVEKIEAQVSAPEDDLEEYIPGPGQTQTVGALDAGSSDLELGSEATGNTAPQLVGVRFRDLNIQKGAIVQHAYLQFQVDATSKNSDPCNIWITAQDAGNPTSFDAGTPFNISARPRLNDSIYWPIPAGSWATVGQAGADQRSTDIAPLVQALVNRGDWAPGQSMVFLLWGVGTREAESQDGSPAGAPKLIVEVLSAGDDLGNPTTVFPVKEKSDWSFFDEGASPGANWTDPSFADATWDFGKGPLGYGISDVTTPVSFGADANNKHITTYFRKRINIADLATVPNKLAIQMRSDDGAIVYINGQEAFRTNMPTGAVTNNTLASGEISGNSQEVYFTFDVNKSLLVTGDNVIAAEVHQSAANGADQIFDLEFGEGFGLTNPTDLGCVDPADDHIGCFRSLIPRDQKDTLEIPSTHVFQYIAFTGDNNTGAGVIPSNLDFTGFVPEKGSSRRGRLALNHERDNRDGGVTIMNLLFDFNTGLWTKDSISQVNFSGVAGTERNCSGTVTPWETVITCEETYGSGPIDSNGDGYADLGWNVEINPVTRQVVGNQKLWAMGRMSHENVVVAPDEKTVYQGEDDGQGSLYKFVANNPRDLSSGLLYVMKLTQPLNAQFDPTGTTGQWVLVPNTTIAERNNVKAFALANGSTFAGIEDVEINPLTGEIYFAVKGFGRIYRLKDDGNVISNFATFVGGQEYRITSGNNVITEDWGLGIDNLTFDDRGNLWSLQDGGRNHVWIVRPNHTQADPKVELFMHTPFGAEPTGMTFTPDYRYMFISIQEPANNATFQADVTGNSQRINRSTAICISRDEFLGKQQVSAFEPAGVLNGLTVYPNPFQNNTIVEVELEDNASVRIEAFDNLGRIVSVVADQQLTAGTHQFDFNPAQSGFYFLRVQANGVNRVVKVVKQ